MNEYVKQANDFAAKFGVKLSVIGEPEYRKYFVDDREYRFVFKLRLKRNKKQYTFTFGQSIAQGSKEPQMYDVLACLTKYDVGDFKNFCDEFGYDIEDRISKNKQVKKIYKNVCKEWEAVERLFGDCLDELQEIQ